MVPDPQGSIHSLEGYSPFPSKPQSALSQNLLGYKAPNPISIKINSETRKEREHKDTCCP